MSSHREAPEISKDPVADSTDTYAFVSTNPGEAGTVTLITNYIPLEDPAGGPNFYEFGDDVLYRINVDNNGDGWPDVMYEFTFPTEVRKTSFLYNNGPIERLESDNWNRRQHATVTEVRGINRTVLGEGLLLPAVQHRAALDARTTPTSPPRRRTTSTGASASSPASASTASTSISGRCSTSAPCARSRTST